MDLRLRHEARGALIDELTLRLGQMEARALTAEAEIKRLKSGTRKLWPLRRSKPEAAQQQPPQPQPQRQRPPDTGQRSV